MPHVVIKVKYTTKLNLLYTVLPAVVSLVLRNERNFPIIAVGFNETNLQIHMRSNWEIAVSLNYFYYFN